MRMTFIRMTFMRMTFIRMTFIRMTFIRMTFIRMTFIRMTFIRMTFGWTICNRSSNELWQENSKEKPQHSCLLMVILLNVVMLNVVAPTYNLFLGEKNSCFVCWHQDISSTCSFVHCSKRYHIFPEPMTPRTKWYRNFKSLNSLCLYGNHISFIENSGILIFTYLQTYFWGWVYCMDVEAHYPRRRLGYRCWQV